MISKSFFIGARCGKPYRHKDLVCWACEGLVVCQDERPGKNGKGKFDVILPDDLAARIDRLVAGMEGIKVGGTLWQRQEYRQAMRDFQGLTECIKEAKAMGDPSDPKVRAFWARHNRSSMVCLAPPKRDPGGYPQMKPLPRGRRTGRTANVDGQAAIVPENVHRIYRPPQRKMRTPVLLDI